MVMFVSRIAARWALRAVAGEWMDLLSVDGMDDLAERLTPEIALPAVPTIETSVSDLSETSRRVVGLLEDLPR